MVYTEIKKINGKKYYYRVLSVREGKKVLKRREYLGKELKGQGLERRVKEADRKLLSKKIEKINGNLENLKPKIIKILKNNHVKRAGIFGSYVRGEQRKDSDIDIIIEPPKGMGFAFAGLEIKLMKALKKRVDLVSYNGLSSYLKERILKEEVRIL